MNYDAATDWREHDAAMREDERAEERAYLRAGLPSPFRAGVAAPITPPQRARAAQAPASGPVKP